MARRGTRHGHQDGRFAAVAFPTGHERVGRQEQRDRAGGGGSAGEHGGGADADGFHPLERGELSGEEIRAGAVGSRHGGAEWAHHRRAV